MRLTRAKLLALAALLAGLAPAQELVLEEVRVEGSFDFGLELAPSEKAVQLMVERLRERAEFARALELQAANRSVITAVLDLTKFIPVPLGASDNRIDTFFLQNYMRADLNPRHANPLLAPE